MNFRRFVASLVSTALITTAPGLATYAAAGQIARSAPAGHAAPVVLPSVNLTGLGNVGSIPSVNLPEVKVGVSQANVSLPATQVSIPNAQSAATLPSAQAQLPQAQQPGLMKYTAAEQQDPLVPSAENLANQNNGEARSTGFRIIDRILGSDSKVNASFGDVDASGLGSGSGASNLAPNSGGNGGNRITPPSPKGPNGPNGRKPWIVRALATGGRVLLGAAAIVGLQIAAVALAPALFGVAPVAAVWAVSSGVLILPAAIYSRYLFSKRDSASLNKTKWALDLFIGAFIGGVIIAAPAFSVALALQAAAIGVPLTVVSGAGTVLAAQAGGRGLDILLTAGTLAFLPALFGVAGAGVIGIGAILAMAALPAMMTIAFFHGRIVTSAETGQPFTVPGSMQKIRFPAFQWVMIGVVFALLSGYGAVHSNLAFMAWTFLGNATGGKWDKNAPLWKNILGFVLNFNVLYVGLLAFTAFTGFTSPLTFLVIAFAPERAAHWTERLLGKLYPKRDAAPSTGAKPADEATFMERFENVNPEKAHWVKLGLLIATMVGTAFTLATFVFGVGSLLKSLGVAVVLAALPFFFSNKLVKAVMKAEPTTAERDPEFFGIMTELREKINKDRAAEGKKAIPMPEMVNVPMDVPNAFATGRSPMKATVGVTVGIKQMLLNPRSVRSQLSLLITSVEPGSKSFKVFRRGIAGSIKGVTESSSAEQISQALERAPDAEIEALGVRMLRGVLGHEFMHVMDRHMLTGSVTGALSSGVAFASYGVMWGVGHAQALGAKLKNWVLGKKETPSQPADRATELGRDEGKGVKPEVLEPISTGIVLKSLPAILRMLAALWGPVIMQILQMTASRNNESQADTDGAKLTGDPESLALALGMLMTWRPPQGFTFPIKRMPRLAALQHMFTVNPLQQLDAAGKLPAKEGTVLGKRENWLFNMFITHPDTRIRIENLYDASERRRDQNPPKGGGGGPAPPLAFAPGAGNNAPTNGRGVVFPGSLTDAPGLGGGLLGFGPRQDAVASRGGLLRRAWVKAAGLWRVLPDEDRNAEYWKFVIGQAVITLGAYFHYAGLPKLAAPTPEESYKLGYNRGVNSASQAASTLVSGPIVDRVSMRKLMVWTHLGRALLMMAVPVLFFHGYLAFPVFLLVIFGAGFLQNTSITAGSVAFQRILGPHTAYYNRANAVFNLVVNITGIVAPLLAGAFIGAMDAKFGLLAGNALAYGVYGLALLATAVGYGLFLKVPAPKANASPDGVRDGSLPLAEAKVRPFAEIAEGFKILWKTRYLRYYLLLGALGMAASDSLIFAALPRYIEHVLGPGGISLGVLADVPVLGAALSGLTSKSGAFGLYLAASSAGMFISSLAMALRRDKTGMDLAAAGARARERLETGEPVLADKDVDAAVEAMLSAPKRVLEGYSEAWETAPELERTPAGLAADAFELSSRDVPAALLERAKVREELETWAAAHWAELSRNARRTAKTGLTDLERQGRWSSYVHGLGWLAYLGVFLYGGLGGSVLAMMLALFLQGPGVVIWSSLTQKVLVDAAPASMGKAYSAMFFFQLAMSIAGVLLFGWLATIIGTSALMLVVAAVVAVCAFFDFLAPSVLFPLRRRKREGPNGR